MDRYIFVNNNNVIDIYSVNIDEEKFKEIQAELDEANGKGELQKKICESLFDIDDGFYGYKIEVVSKKYVGKKEQFYLGITSDKIVDMYEYEYYAYVPCSLSTLCDKVLQAKGGLELSNYLNELYKFRKNQNMFSKLLLSTISYSKIDVENFSYNDLTITEKANVLNRILNCIKQTKQESIVVTSPKQYDTEVEEVIKNSENRKRCYYGNDFLYSEEETKKIKQLVLSTLPTDIYQ